MKSLVSSILLFIIIIFATLFDGKVPYKEEESPIFENIVKKEISIYVLGDMMFDRNVRILTDEFGFEYLFENIKDELEKPDLLVANLEGPITSNKSITIDLKNKALQFTFPTSTALNLKKHSFDIVSLANNHGNDFGNSGYEETKKWLSESGVGYFGDYFNRDNEYKTEVNGIRISFFGFNEFSYNNFEKVLEDIKNSDSDIKIVMPHWGTEYENQNNTFQQKWGRALIDSGADAVIGSHPHVIQNIEWYKERPIVYSLGNFIFDQYWRPEVKKGMFVKILIDQDKKIEYEFVEFESEKSQVKGF